MTKLHRRHVIVGVVVLVLSVLIVRVLIPPALFLLGVVTFTRKWSAQASQARDHLFFETDYQELLTACRSLSSRAAAGEFENRSCFNVHLGKRDPETLSFPEVILDLKPARVLMDFHRPAEVIIELFPGPEWFGVMAFPEGSEGQGDAKLIDGLWYFDSAYNEKQPEYVKRINMMIEEGRQRKEQHRALQPAMGTTP